MADNAEVTVSEGTASLIFAETPFYAEMGGQVADHGQILDAAGNVVATFDRCSKSTKWTTTSYCWSSCSSCLEPRIHLGDRYQSSSSCHEEPHCDCLLHAALHNILATMQPKQDPLNEAEFLAWLHLPPQAVTPEELRAIEQQVNEKIGKRSQSKQLKQISISKK